MRQTAAGLVELVLDAQGDCLPLELASQWWAEADRPRAEAWFRDLLTRTAPPAPQSMMVRAVAGPLAGGFLRFEADPPVQGRAIATVTGRVSDFVSQLSPLRRALDFIDYSHLGTWMLDVPSGALDLDEAWAEILGHKLEALQPFTHADWVAMTHPDDAMGFDSPEIAARLAAGEVVHYVSRTRHAQGHWVWFLTCCRAALWDTDGTLLRVIGYDIDITEHRALLARTEDQRVLMARILDVMPSGQLVVDEGGRITFCNPVAAELIGMAPERTLGLALQSVLPLEEGHDTLRAALASAVPVANVALVLRPHAQAGVDDAVRHFLADPAGPPPQDAGRRHILAHFTQVPGMGKTFVTLSDMTAHETAKRGLEHAVAQARFIATHDLMTGLPDRYDFLHRLSQTVAEAGPQMRPVAVMMIDLDNFKLVNDGMGHDKGDQLIKAAAARLERGLPDRARLSRFGGDEFVLMLPDCTPTEAALWAEDLRDRFADPMTFSLRHSLMSCSIGLALFPQDAQRADDLMRCADLAMYEAKALGRGQIRRFSPELRERKERRNAVAIAVQRAISEGGFHIVLQPKFDLRDLVRPIGAEVLIRLNDPDLGAVSPAEFIPIAEGQGLIPAIDREVVRLVAELRAGAIDLPLSINLSALTLSGPGFGDLLDALPRLAGKGGIMVEVTETSFMGRLGPVRDTLHLLRRSGVGVAVDDFGIGHSSLAYLQSLPIQEIKIDRSFIAGLGRDEGPSQAIVRAILAMAEALGLATVAEGVETTDQANWLLDHGCYLAQGFLLGRPVDPQEFHRIYLQPRKAIPLARQSAAPPVRP
ncbi:EAL domain-containing protein [Rhodobacter sp. KR11]|uniref:putative bifunctional diguanylate cyclase/phosphodiesterase n=1 Tax=Rhodobacter sp. KR11 TaxID=2974588 RepID=UPI002223CEC1|nr:GGDEF and EAL domain-containing protein [Rhodobacter sp. KR11]MCW1919834.1 EAL domain-containing protein [Rhodobacter sp. KR11]